MPQTVILHRNRPMPALPRRTVGILLILISALAFGVMPILGAYAYRAGADTQGVLLARFTLAAIVMLLAMQWRRAPWPKGRLLLGLLLMGGVGYVGQAFSYFSALRYGSAALAALLLYLYPMLVTVLSVLWFGAQLSRHFLLALPLALLGLWLTMGGQVAAHGLGIAFGLLAAVIYSGYILAGSRLSPRAGALPAASVIMLAAAAGLWLSCVWSTPTWPAPGAGWLTGWLAIGGIALISTVIAIFTFLAGMDRLSAAEASTLSTLEPIVSIVLAAALLGDTFTASQWLGSLAIVISALLIALAPTATVQGA